MFSVVIASRDRVTLLQRTVAALAEQTVPPSAVIVVDDGSIDGTWEWLSGLECQRLVAVRTAGVGVSEARNRGLQHVTTEWVIFLDDDDEPDAAWLQGLAGLVADDVGLASCAVTLDGPTQRSTRHPIEHPAVAGKVLLLTGAFATRSKLMREVGGYLGGLTYSENSELGIRLLEVCRTNGLRAAHTDVPLLTVRQTRERRSKIDRHHAVLMIIDQHRRTFENDPSRMARWLSIAGVDAFRAGDHQLARHVFARAMRAKPSLRNGERLLLSCVPFLGRRVWSTGRHPLDHEP